MSATVRDKRVLLIVSGGIAAYKTPALVRFLVKAGATVKCVMTRASGSFVAPLALATVSGHPVYQEMLDPSFEAEIGHIELARWADIIVVAPATANLIAKMAQGLCDDLATTLLLATTAKVLVCPAMNTQMLRHPATVANLDLLGQRGVAILAPDAGELACKEVGAGRLPDPEIIEAAISKALSPSPLAGKKVAISAGATEVYLDPVRYITNPSTGKMGLAFARAAVLLGAEVTVYAGRTTQVDAVCQHFAQVERFTTGEDLLQKLTSHVSGLDWLIMAAAVGDFAPATPEAQKRKKSEGAQTWELSLERTVDVLATLGHDPARPEGLRLIGFAAETNDLRTYATQKLTAKRCDAIVANWVSSVQGNTFGSDEASVIVLGNGFSKEFSSLPKPELAAAVWSELITELGV